MGKDSLPKYTGKGPNNTYFNVDSPQYASSDNLSYDQPSFSRGSGTSSYQSRSLYHSSSYKSDRLDDKIIPYNSFPSALSGVCPTCQRPLSTDKPIYMDATRQKKAA